MVIGSAMAKLVCVEPMPEYEPSSAGAACGFLVATDAVVVVFVVEDVVDAALVVVACSCGEVVVVFGRGSGSFQVLVVSSPVDVEVVVSDVLVLVEVIASGFCPLCPKT